jgi:4-hydroxy-tetrahydrodipicolinate reductase
LCKESDVIIDFSSKEGALNLVHHAKDYQGIKLIICSTGFNEQDLTIIKQAASKIGILLSPNTSIGANLISNISVFLAKALKNQNIDIDILETHHNKKKDAPSGTALMIANSIRTVLQEYKVSIMDASKIRETKQIIVTSIRSGNNPGIHEIIFSCENENIKLIHEATSKEAFAKGALQAAIWLANKEAGKLYTMQDTLKLNISSHA